MVTLVAHGCPVPALTAAFGFPERTVRDGIQAAGGHAHAVHAALVQPPRALEHVQAAEIRGQGPGQSWWMALALLVSTRLWLGGAVSAKRDRTLIDRRATQIRACALRGVRWVAVAGLSSYGGALQRAFRERVPRGGRGAPRKVIWDGLVNGQVGKPTARRRVGQVGHGMAHGTATAAVALLARTGSQVLNTAYSERLNGTVRERLAPLARRTRHLLRKSTTREAGMYLVGTVYNFCTPQESLRTAERPRWQPPKQRGRRAAALKRLIARWAA